MLMDLILKHILRYRQGIVVCAHILLVVASNLLAFLVRFDWVIPPDYFSMIAVTLPLIVLVRLGAFHLFGVHHGSWRYVSIRDLVSIIKAVTLSSVVLVMIIYLFLGYHQYPRSIYFVDWLILIMLIGGARMNWRIFREFQYFGADGGKRVLLIGARDAGEMILREMKQNPKLQYQPIGFIDDDVRKGLKIHGVPILGTRKDFLKIVKEHKIEEVIITIASATARQMREIVKDCEAAHLVVKTLPGIDETLSGQVSVAQLREVRLEDLLYREVIKTDTKHIAAYLHEKKVLVTGAAGSIGSELCFQISRYHPKMVILFDQSESNLYFIHLELEAENPDVSYIPIVGDIQDTMRVTKTLKRFRPDVIFHSAAYKHVPLLEQNSIEAVKNNVIATRNLALLARDFSVNKFILISTDKAVNPTSVMGVTKRIAELYVQELSGQSPTQFTIVRFGNVMGSNGSVIPLFKKQIEKKGPVTVTHPEIKRYFMTIPEAVQLVLQATIMGKGGEIFVFDMGEQVKILDLARHMISLSGFQPDEHIKIIFSGLRPGEKLFEELFDHSEDTQGTEHNKIMKALVRNVGNSQALSRKIDELELLLVEDDHKAIILKLKEIVPSYQPEILSLNEEPEL